MIKQFFYNFGKFLFFLTPSIFRRFDNVIWAINTGFHVCGMKSVGRHVTLEHPVRKLIGRQYISIGDKCYIGRNAVITAWDQLMIPEIVIGKQVVIGDDCHITAANSIIIGNGTLMGKKVTITDNSHGAFTIEDLALNPLDRAITSKGKVVVGEKVWIGDKVTICPGVTIGNGAIIGANAVVTKDIPERSIAVGNPARVIKTVK